MRITITNLMLLLSFSTFAQFNISIGPELGVPANFSKSTSVGLGGSIDFTYKISPSVAPRLSVGYNRFKGKYLVDDIISFVPVRAGLQGILADVIILYGEAGIAFYNAKRNGTSTSNFSYALGAGYKIPILERNYIQLTGSYNFFKHSDHLNYTWFNFRIAYGFNFGKFQPSESVQKTL